MSSVFARIVLAGAACGAGAAWLKRRSSYQEPIAPATVPVAAPEPEPVPEPAPTYSELTPEATSAEVDDAPKWQQPVGGSCPTTHPIKARFSTGRYHLPDDRGYDRLIANCCYATEAEAQAEGFSHSRW